MRSIKIDIPDDINKLVEYLTDNDLEEVLLNALREYSTYKKESESLPDLSDILNQLRGLQLAPVDKPAKEVIEEVKEEKKMPAFEFTIEDDEGEVDNVKMNDFFMNAFSMGDDY